jgi:hypothetical protein
VAGKPHRRVACQDLTWTRPGTQARSDIQRRAAETTVHRHGLAAVDTDSHAAWQASATDARLNLHGSMQCLSR